MGCLIFYPGLCGCSGLFDAFVEGKQLFGRSVESVLSTTLCVMFSGFVSTSA